uniref:non-specific serine/threonine protein kinase n=2 Tax=Cacopsylla melanoneura TaxID=428564 RepID=A0A8D8LTM2_9HEMI
MEESLQERQDNELEALEAIFGNDLQNKRPQNGKWSPLDIELTVYPQQGSSFNTSKQVHAKLNLRVQCSAKYPNKVPHIELTKSKGLSSQQLTHLHEELTELMGQLRGEVMIFNLVQHIQKVLHDYNQPGYQSFYDEMVVRQQQQDEQAMLLKKAEEDQMRQRVLTEIQFKTEAIRDEFKRKRNPTLTFNREETESESCAITPPSNTCSPKHEPWRHKLKDSESNSPKSDEMLSQWKNIAHSRVDKEFELLDWLGKGAFGDVLKVRNKLDDRLYAIKRIPLNPKNKQLNKKIMREVKLLSRLNHENVVRYYNSWIESGTSEIEDSEDEEESISMRAVPNLPAEHRARKQQNGKTGVGRAGAGGIDVQPLQQCGLVDNEDLDDEDSDSGSRDDDWISFLPGSRSAINDDSDSFSSSSEEDSSSDNSSDNTATVTSNGNIARFMQYMYIQMEFCEKSTLRSAIDNGLCEDMARVWRLLREIIEGLSHIHSQGIIHRDLKPVNIFIDYDDHVKIGDFGLATNILQKHAAGPLSRELTGYVLPPPVKSDTLYYSNETSHTGQVGTALYSAPELDSHGVKAMYNQKVDIYSLGIIFFEMCYHPLNTNMERMKILSDLRLKEIKLPPDFCTAETYRQVYIVRWCLNHDPSKRPSYEQLLADDHIPPPQVGETVLQDMVRQTLSNPQSKGYKYLVAACFNQKVSPADDITYDISLSRAANFSLLESTGDKLRRIFQLHGGVYFQTPLLTPLNRLTTGFETTAPMMTRGGSVVSLPHDLRIPFARYLAQNGSIVSMKRYCIDRVYRERRVLGFHPRELVECAFDIVTPTPGNLMAEAELIAMLWEIVSEFPGLLDKNCMVRINHYHLVTGILLHCGVEEQKHDLACKILRKTKSDELSCNPNSKLSSRLSELDLADHNINSLLSLMSLELSYSKVVAQLKPLTKKNTLAATFVKKGLKQLELVIANTESLGVKCPLMITPGLLTDINIYSGTIFQLVWDQKNKHHRLDREVVAVGGRYDNLISFFKTMLDVSPDSSSPQCGAGLSLSLDKLVSAGSSVPCSSTPNSTCDVLLYSIGKGMLHTRLNIVRDLWQAGVRCTVLEQQEDFESIQSYCLSSRIPCIVFLKESEPGLARLRTLGKDSNRFQEKRVQLNELVECVIRMIRCDNTGVNTGRSDQTRHRTTSEARQNSVGELSAADVNVTLLTENQERISAAARRRYEHQILNTLSSSLQKLSPRVKVEVVALQVEADFVRSLASLMDIKDNAGLVKKFPRHKKIVTRVLEHLESLSDSTVLVFYSIMDSVYKFVL